MGWEQEVARYREAGFSDTDIQNEEQRRRKLYFDAGFSVNEIDAAFGVKQFDPTALKEHFAKSLPQPAENPQGVKEADSFISALEAGFQMSVSGLMARGEAPNVQLSRNAGMAYRIASQIGTLAGDIPAMFAGGVGGGIAGSEVPIVGNVIGAGIGSFALPAALRKIMMDHYEKGDVKSFSDFWERTSATFIESAKAGIVGGATSGVGGVAGKAFAPIVGEALTPAAKTLSEIGTMVTVGSALEGEMPEPTHFLEAAILVGGLHGVSKASAPIAKTLRQTFADTGLTPWKVVEEVDNNPHLKEQFNAKNPDQAKINEILTGEKGPSPEEKLAAQAKLAEGEPVTPTTPSESPPLNPDESVKMMMDQIGERTAKVKKPYTFDQFYTDFVDKFNPIKQAVNLMVTDPKALLDNENPYSLARMVNGYKAKVKYIYEKGAYDFQTLGKIKDAPVFKDIVDKHRDSIHEFNAYLISARGLELMKRSGEAAIENIFSSDPAKETQLRAAAKATVEKLSGKYAESAKQLVELQNHNLKILKDSGRISQEQFDAMVEANKSYIPFKRLLEIESETGGKKQGKGFLKQITGASEGAEKIQNPLVSILDNTETVVRLSEMNRASLALVKMFESSGTDLAEKLPNQLKATEVSKEEMLRYFKKNNIDATPEAMTVFRQSQKYNLAENQFEVYRDGKREVWQTKDPELAKAINALGGDPTASNVIIKLFRGVTAIKKLGISLTPEFIARNFLRDQMTAQAFSKNPSWKPQIVDTVVAIGDILGKKDSYYQFLKSGGAGGAFIETSKLIDRNLFELNKEVGFIDQVRNQVRKSVDFVEAGARLVEEAPRLAEHKRVVGGAESGPKLFEGGMASREITVDFQRIGAKMSAFNAITAFQNVSIQGLDRTIRAIKENPKSMASGVSMITGISVMLWAVNKDEKWYQELPRWEKDLFWHIKAGDVVYRFPKPQELGVMFGSLPERILEAWHETESMTSPIPAKAISGFGETLGGLIMPSFIPDAMTPALEQFTNKSFFTGQPIVPQRVESLLPEFQAMEYTSKTAQALGKLVGNVPFVKDIGAKDTKLASPMVIENYIRSWGGTLGTYALQVADKAQEASGVARNVISGNYEMSIQGGKDLFVASLSDVPVIKAFVSRYPNASTQSIKDFRERFQESQRVFNTLRTLEKAGRLDEYTDVMNRHSGDMVKLNGINESISKMGQYIQLVNQTNYSKSDKLNLINSVYHQMIDMARTGNDMIEQFDKAMRASKKRSRLIP